MTVAQELESWHDLYVMLGTSAAALLGLLFVATSLHVEEIASDLVFERRARSNTLHLTFALAEAAAILTPQPLVTLGGLLTAMNAVWVLVPLRNVYLFFYKSPETGRRGGWVVWRAAAFISAFALGVAGGAIVLAQSIWGLYLVTTGYVLVLVTVALNSWSIMMGIGRMEKAAEVKTDSRRKRS
jgi:hypothetical protein